MSRKIAIAASVLTALLAAGCSRQPTPTINESMTQVMEPQAQTLWDVTARAFNEKGDGFDGAKLTAKDWAQLEDAGRQLEARSMALAKARTLTVAGPGETVLGADAAGAPSSIGHEWDAASAKQVKAKIDANPALFAEKARVLAQSGQTIATAAREKDAQKLYQVTSNLDEVCDGCHEKFWGTDENPPFPH